MKWSLSLSSTDGHPDQKHSFEALIAKYAETGARKFMPSNLALFLNLATTLASLRPLTANQKDSVYYCTNDELRVGQFFIGKFKYTDRWRCVKVVTILSNILDVAPLDNGIEVYLTVFQRNVPYDDNEYPMAYDRYIGRITDKFEQLPQDCSKGVRIAVRKMKVGNEYQWCVYKVMETDFVHVAATHMAPRMATSRTMINDVIPFLFS
ncbi:unnamed protein product [Caenorhabditis bovis]|uniref:Uncharacterized protein n=1 Tax=Caenorhabditis bovis TaxID=2654633 RepID=A0A8S1F2A3_9PELO|nr:unnamed protein product [Caenorhabditis bovis]